MCSSVQLAPPRCCVREGKCASHDWVLIISLMVIPLHAFAVDGVVLINQSTVMAAGSFPYAI